MDLSIITIYTICRYISDANIYILGLCVQDASEIDGLSIINKYAISRYISDANIYILGLYVYDASILDACEIG